MSCTIARFGGKTARLASNTQKGRCIEPFLRCAPTSLQARRGESTSAAPNATQARQQDVNQTSSVQPTATLAQILARSINAAGPLPISSFMAACLQDPALGYYTSANAQEESKWKSAAMDRDVLGARGDFITSPEISQVFGELCAIFFIARSQAVDTTAPMRIVELGPGRGTLLTDMIRTFASFKSFFANFKEIHLVESSPGLQRLQLEAVEQTLKQTGKKVVQDTDKALADDEVRIRFFDTVEQVSIEPTMWTMVTAHEFFDALPARIFQRTTEGFREVLVDVEQSTKSGQSGITVIKASDLTNVTPAKDASNPAQAPKFRYVLSPKATPWSMLLGDRNPRFRGLQPGQRVEVSFEAWAAARKVGELVAGRRAKEGAPEQESDGDRTAREAREVQREASTAALGGAGLIIDYGDEKAFGGSFRAFKAHKIVDPLEAPGTADLTVNVDFAYVKNAVESTDARPAGLLPQAHFLQSLGLQQRVEALMARAADDERRKVIEQAAERLVDLNGMGVQYKVLGVCAEAYTPAEQQTNEKEADGDAKVPCYPFEP